MTRRPEEKSLKNVSEHQIKIRVASRSSSRSSSKAKGEKETDAGSVPVKTSWWWLKDPNHLVRDASKRSKRMSPGE